MSVSTLIVGGGNMGTAMISGWIERGRDPGSIVVVEPDAARGAALTDRFGIGSLGGAEEVPPDLTPEAVVLAVKPPLVSDVLRGYRSFLDSGALLISVAAGIRISTLTDGLGSSVAVIRAMPNTPAAIGRGMTVLCAGQGVSDASRGLGENLMRAIGDVAWIDDEALMDAVTAVSGSGPAYVFYLAECLAAAGIDAGLPAPLAAHLAQQTVAGAGELLLRSDAPPADLRQNVTSPGGTTAAALSVLMAEPGLRTLLSDAVSAAAARSRQMAS